MSSLNFSLFRRKTKQKQFQKRQLLTPFHLQGEERVSPAEEESL